MEFMIVWVGRPVLKGWKVISKCQGGDVVNDTTCDLMSLNQLNV